MNPTYTPAVVASALAFALALASSSVLAAEPDDAEIVARQIGPAIEAELIPGAVVGIYHDGETSFYPVGVLNYDQDQSPTIDTLYEIGSISKVLTGVLFADAIRRGEVERETLVNDLLPDGFKARSRDGQEIELWHLTTHTSGWMSAPINLRPADGENPFSGYTQEMMFDAAKIMPLITTPGTKFAYSNFGVGVLGTLIANNAESVNKGDYEALVTERILEPLGIEDFAIELDEDQHHRLAPATAGGRETKAWGKTGAIDPAGMWVTSAPGLMKFAMANLVDGDDGIHKSLALAREPMFAIEGRGQVCFGWFIAADGSSYWHNGMTGGYSSYMAVNRDLDIAVVVLANGASLEITAVGEKILQSLAGMNPDPIAVELPEKLDEAFTDRLVGVYTSRAGFDMTISAARGRLFAQVTGQQALELAAVSENRFRFKQVDAELEFDVPEEGQASRVTLFQNGMEIECERKE